MVLGNLGWISGSMGDYARAKSYSAQNLRLAREVGDRYSEALEMVNLSAYSGRLGDLEAAVNHAQQGLDLARQINDSSGQAWAQTYLGHAQLESGNLELAVQAYRAAEEIRQSLNQPNLSCEPLAGLGRAALQAGDVPAASEYATRILAYLQGEGTLDGTDEPLRVYLSCYQILQAAGNPQADDILETAHALLQEKAQGIQEPALRRTFLEDIPYHREIISAWDKYSMCRPSQSPGRQS
jgi:tetratricopeptide (TPR) repeat protein